MKLTWEQVRARRLGRSRLTERADSIVEAVRDTCGIQAQLQSAAELGIGIRTVGTTQEEVRAELWERRTLVRTWTLRGTLHLHPADELGLWTTAMRRVKIDRGVYDLEPKRLTRLLDAFVEALDGRALLREELAGEVSRRVGAWAREPLASGWAFLLDYAADAAILCHGPPRGTKVTFVRADQWLGEIREWNEQDALLEVTRRLLGAYGPATAKTLTYLGVKDGAPLLDTLGDELVEVDVEGRQAWLLAEDLDVPEPRASVHLLPQYDCYVIGFRGMREHLLWGEARELYWDTRWKKEGRYETPVGFANVLVDGAIAGKWERRQRGNRLEVELQTAGALDAEHAELLERELDRIGEFSGRTVSV